MTKIKNNIDGILLLDKPLHLSSNGALQRVKRLYNAKKAGHTGSLDPLATGMLPLCFGKATKLAQKLLESNKSYQVTIKFGEKTTTGDAEGEVIETAATDHITLELLQEILKKFTGPIEQIPPMYSALKHQGKPLYELARQGISIERKARSVTIFELTLDHFEMPSCQLTVHCSKGTYIRTLAEDIGTALNSCAYVTALRRTAVAPFQETQMISLDVLEKMYESGGALSLQQYLLPI